MAINAHIINRAEDVDAVVDHILKEVQTFPFIALDCEWVTNSVRQHRYPVALMQISTKSTIYLFRMRHLDRFSRQKLSAFLSDSNIIKVGVGIATDARLLKTDYNLTVRSWLDLRYFSEHIGAHILPPRSMAIMARQLLGIEMDKSTALSCSNWQARRLTPQQIRYAADDVRISMLILEKVLQIFNHNYNVNKFDSWNTVRRLIHGDLESEFIYKRYLAEINV